MPARQTANTHELSQGSRHSLTILQLLLLTTCESLGRHNIGQETWAFYINNTHFFLETHRREQAVEEAPANPQE